MVLLPETPGGFLHLQHYLRLLQTSQGQKARVPSAVPGARGANISLLLTRVFGAALRAGLRRLLGNQGARV